MASEIIIFKSLRVDYLGNPGNFYDALFDPMGSKLESLRPCGKSEDTWNFPRPGDNGVSAKNITKIPQFLAKVKSEYTKSTSASVFWPDLFTPVFGYVRSLSAEEAVPLVGIIVENTEDILIHHIFIGDCGTVSRFYAANLHAEDAEKDNRHIDSLKELKVQVMQNLERDQYRPTEVLVRFKAYNNKSKYTFKIGAFRNDISSKLTAILHALSIEYSQKKGLPEIKIYDKTQKIYKTYSIEEQIEDLKSVLSESIDRINSSENVPPPTRLHVIALAIVLLMEKLDIDSSVGSVQGILNLLELDQPTLVTAINESLQQLVAEFGMLPFAVREDFGKNILNPYLLNDNQFIPLLIGKHIEPDQHDFATWEVIRRLTMLLNCFPKQAMSLYEEIKDALQNSSLKNDPFLADLALIRYYQFNATSMVGHPEHYDNTSQKVLEKLSNTDLLPRIIYAFFKFKTFAPNELDRFIHKFGLIHPPKKLIVISDSMLNLWNLIKTISKAPYSAELYDCLLNYFFLNLGIADFKMILSELSKPKEYSILFKVQLPDNSFTLRFIFFFILYGVHFIFKESNINDWLFGDLNSAYNLKLIKTLFLVDPSMQMRDEELIIYVLISHNVSIDITPEIIKLIKTWWTIKGTSELIPDGENKEFIGAMTLLKILFYENSSPLLKEYINLNIINSELYPIFAHLPIGDKIAIFLKILSIIKIPENFSEFQKIISDHKDIFYLINGMLAIISGDEITAIFTAIFALNNHDLERLSGMFAGSLAVILQHPGIDRAYKDSYLHELDYGDSSVVFVVLKIFPSLNISDKIMVAETLIEQGKEIAFFDASIDDEMSSLIYLLLLKKLYVKADLLLLFQKHINVEQQKLGNTFSLMPFDYQEMIISNLEKSIDKNPKNKILLDYLLGMMSPLYAFQSTPLLTM